MSTDTVAKKKQNPLLRYIPILERLTKYDRKFLSVDLIVGTENIHEDVNAAVVAITEGRNNTEET